MALVCALSGVTPEEPVISPSGYLFEKRIIIKALGNSEECPITGEKLTVDSLKPVQTTKIVKPRPVTATSIPGLLSLFQNEWDATMAETFALRKHTDQVRQQLSHTLYQHDASCRVISRLLRERDASIARSNQLQAKLNSLEANMASGRGMEAETGMTDEVLNEVIRLSKLLPFVRKQRERNAPYDSQLLSSLTCDGSYPLHQTTAPGVTCCAVDRKPSNKSIIATGGVDGNIVLFDITQQRTRSKLGGHMKTVNSVAIHPKEETIISVSDDRTSRVWRRLDDADSYQYVCAHVCRSHMDAVIDLSIHPVGSFYVTCSRDNSWALQDIISGRTFRTETDPNVQCRCVQFHPDGPILGLGGDDGSVYIWDMKTKTPNVMASLSEHKSGISCLAFSENGFHLATASDDSTVKLWDLRRSLVFQTLTCKAPNTEQQQPVNSISFDYSGNFIGATSGKSIHMFYMASKANATTGAVINGHQDTVTDFCFAHPDSSFMVSTSMDRNVNIWKPQTEKEGDDDNHN